MSSTNKNKPITHKKHDIYGDIDNIDIQMGDPSKHNFGTSGPASGSGRVFGM